MKKQKQENIKKAVRETYGDIARGDRFGCGIDASCCGDTAVAVKPDSAGSERLGYSKEDLDSVPMGANMGLGCGNPQAIANLKKGETVLDLGSGGGFDCFLAARQVGEKGHVIGVDMTPDMVGKARVNAEKGGYGNVEFRLGEIEHVPVASDSVDAIISNCVINLAPDKPAVYREAFRVLKSGGRLAITDVVATAELPDEVKDDLALVSGCVAGAATIDALTKAFEDIGYQDIQIDPITQSREIIRDWVPGTKIEDYVVSATIEAKKP